MKKPWDNEEEEKKPSEKKILTDDISSLIVRIIEDNAEDLHVSLGITEEGSQKIQELIYNELEKKAKGNRVKANTSELMVALSKECTHANQLAFGCFALGRITAEKSIGRPRVGGISIGPKGIEHFSPDTADLPDFLKEILRDILRRKGEDPDKEN